MHVLKRLIRRGVREAYALTGRDHATGLKIHARPGVRLGSEYGGWWIPNGALSVGSVCYCVGAGEDISFDIALSKIGCDVFTFDPTPRAIAYVQKIGVGVKFFPIGVWSEDGVLSFYAPKNPAHVSHSIVNLQKTGEHFEATCKTVATIMRENGHAQLDLLKLDIEGAEYEVIQSLFRDQIHPRVLCVEFDELHHPLDSQSEKRIRSCSRSIQKEGYILANVDKSNFTFVLI